MTNILNIFKKNLKSIITLVCICAVVAVLMAFTNALTYDKIQKNADLKASAALSEVMPGGAPFTLMQNIDEYNLPESIIEVHKSSNGGFVFKLKAKGYQPGMIIMCGIDANGYITGAKYLEGAETNGAEITMSQRVPGATLETIGDVDTATSPTAPLTVNGYLSAIKDALNSAIVLSGGEADFRTEEEIFNDNLSLALPSAEGKFTKHFFIEIVTGVDAIYVADNSSGAVCVIGENLVAVDSEGNVIGEVSEENAALASSAVAAIKATTTEDIDLSLYEGISNRVKSVKLTSDGNYVIEIEAAGYGITGGDQYHPASGKYIEIKLSISSDGMIIDCVTLSQYETDGIGSACADEKFYGQFDGKTEQTYTDIDVIGGATLTTNGYKTAILRAFQAFNIIAGGNENE